MEAKHSGEPGWKWRRSIIFPVVAFACWRLAMLEGAADTRVNERLGDAWALIVLVLVVGYAGFATAQDVVAIWRTRSGLPYEAKPAPGEPVAGEGTAG